MTRHEPSRVGPAAGRLGSDAPDPGSANRNAQGQEKVGSPGHDFDINRVFRKEIVSIVNGASDRRLRILELLIGSGSADLETGHLCAVSTQVAGMTGAGITLMSDDAPRGSICTTDKVSALMEELEFTLGEGPCVDAYRHQRPVMEPNLANPVSIRWQGFTGPVLEAGAKAVFGFPIQIGAIKLGALNLYRDRPGPMADEQHADAMVMSDIAAHAILVQQSNAPPGILAAELASGFGIQYVIHQATGMVAAQLECDVKEALARLRAYAYSVDRPLVEVARDVVSRRLRFRPEGEADS